MHFSARDSSFFFVKYGARPFFARPFLRHKFFFMILFYFILFYFYFFKIFKFFLVLVCFQDEVKQHSSWKFFDWNRFGNDVFELKKLMVF